MKIKKINIVNKNFKNSIHFIFKIEFEGKEYITESRVKRNPEGYEKETYFDPTIRFSEKKDYISKKIDKLEIQIYEKLIKMKKEKIKHLFKEINNFEEIIKNSKRQIGNMEYIIFENDFKINFVKTPSSDLIIKKHYNDFISINSKDIVEVDFEINILKSELKEYEKEIVEKFIKNNKLMRIHFLF